MERLEKVKHVVFDVTREINVVELVAVVQFGFVASELTEYSPPLVQFPKISKVGWLIQRMSSIRSNLNTFV